VTEEVLHAAAVQESGEPEIHFKTTGRRSGMTRTARSISLSRGVGPAAPSRASVVPETGEEAASPPCGPSSRRRRRVDGDPQGRAAQARAAQDPGDRRGFKPDVLDLDLVDDIETITDQEAVEMAKRLHREEGITCGILFGRCVVAAVRVGQRPESRASSS